MNICLISHIFPKISYFSVKNDSRVSPISNNEFSVGSVIGEKQEFLSFIENR